MKTPSRVGAQGASNKTTIFLLLLLLAFIILMVAAFGYAAIKGGQYTQYSSIAAQQQLLSQRMAANALEAISGEEQSLAQLKTLRDEFDVSLQRLGEGDAATGLPAAPAGLQDTIGQVGERWTQFRGDINAITGGSESITVMNKAAGNIRKNLPRMLAASDQVTSALIKTKADADQVYIASRQLLILQRIENSLNQLLAGDANAPVAADRLGRDTVLFSRFLQGMQRGNPALNVQAVADATAQAKLKQVDGLFKEVGAGVDTILSAAPAFLEVAGAAASVKGNSDNLLALSGDLEQAVTQSGSDFNKFNILGGIFGLLALATLIILGFTLIGQTRRQLAVSDDQNRRNQDAILLLLDEMSNLADGDLSSHTTVTEEVTGAIADSVNYSIDALRELVGTINTTAVEVSAAAERTQGTAQQLATASSMQAREIASASAAITDIADSIQQVSTNAEASAEVAQRSVQIASKGAQTVSRTIAGMDTIREQIQETSKRIKRLGESSQEIGDIVGLINEIADQTNILALNAAIQASTAGEAGRGFAVVADEVQRLAERASNATKQIEALVKTIQTDTNEAVISMEQSTANVVGGAKLAEDAGEALTEIEKVSTQLSEMIGSISSSAREQSSSAANITNTMKVIQEITMKTSDGTSETAASIGDLSNLAQTMRDSVAGFKLPESGA